MSGVEGGEVSGIPSVDAVVSDSVRRTGSSALDVLALKRRMEWLGGCRPSQLPPCADWATWMIMTGRGWGKTRTAAEDVWWYCIENPGVRVAVVAPTFDDIRQTCFEGESGLLACCPDKLIESYNRSLFTIDFVNGSHIRGFSSEKPDRLRGPQFHRCLDGNSIIMMGDGTTKLLKDVKEGDEVMTRRGPRRVLFSGITGNKELYCIKSLNNILLATKEHKVYTRRGWVAVCDLEAGDVLCTLNTVEENGINAKMGITRVGVKEVLDTKACAFIERCMKTCTDKFLKGMLFTIRTAIKATMTSLIWASFFFQNILNFIAKYRRIPIRPKYPQEVDGIGVKLNPKRTNVSFAENNTNPGTPYDLGDTAAKNVWTNGDLTRLVNCAIVKFAVKSLLRLVGPIRCAATSVGTKISSHTQNKRCAHIIVRNVVKYISLCKKRPVFAPWNALDYSTSVLSVEATGKCAPVYDLTIETDHEFFANGILVHNCWCEELAAWSNHDEVWAMLKFGLRLGKDPRVIITTTPKPVALVKQVAEDKSTVLTRGSTFDNKSNLPTKFFDELMVYEGTTIGRQELHGELIDLAEMGIFKNSWFRLWPSTTPLPAFSLIVQSWDTAMTERTENDPTACTTWGLVPVSEGHKAFRAVLCDAWSEHLAYPDLRERAMREFQVRYGPSERRPDIVLIEDKGSGITLRQDLQRAGIPVRKYNPGRADKVQRAHTVSHLVKNGALWIPESSNPKRKGQFRDWANPMIEQMCYFPNVTHDDYVDTVTQFLALMRDMSYIQGDEIKEEQMSYWRRLAMSSNKGTNPYFK